MTYPTTRPYFSRNSISKPWNPCIKIKQVFQKSILLIKPIRGIKTTTAINPDARKFLILYTMGFISSISYYNSALKILKLISYLNHINSHCFAFVHSKFYEHTFRCFLSHTYMLLLQPQFFLLRFMWLIGC